MRIGLISDTHMPGSQQALWPQVFDAFEGVEYILHAGDLHTLDVVEQLESLAPTYVARGNGDAGIEDERVRDNWLLNLGAVNIGMIHRFPSPDRRSGEQLSAYANRHFGAPPDIIIYGHTHCEAVHAHEDRLYVNPGSPTLPRNQSLRLGTIGLLEVKEEHVTATILQLTPAGTVPHDEFAFVNKAISKA